MSYCRWSTDDYLCDLYCFEHVAGGYVTYVSCRRVVYREPLPPRIVLSEPSVKSWWERFKKVQQMHKEADFEPITLPHAGEEFWDRTLEGLRERLLMLRMVGYRFPDSVFKMIDAEIAEKKTNNLRRRPRRKSVKRSTVES